MSEVLATLSVAPLYGQMIVESEGATDLPVPETGKERVVATTQSIMIATRGDADGNVDIEIHGNRNLLENGLEIFEGELSFASPNLVYGSPLAGVVDKINIGRTGWVLLKIYVDVLESPTRVVVVIN